ncbi:DUF4924 family protein [Cecembia rubra]|uniref:Uncharacterized protein DUF4924 n=1 Tax=Cecembia rubra TaxID=1485585 RepID=A0A2P8E9U1_9BACT|nr:DUF4924 family protein [Cecembia rubra]PSL06241.1 uncharacterized protein DUF4924 [Cecembia rubra]
MKAVADRKRKQNIAEYIIYMYQMEDLLRAYQFNLEDIGQYVVSHYPISAKEKQETISWFQDLSDKMIAQHLEKGGHIQETQFFVDALARLHWELLKKDKSYFEIYQEAKPHLIQLIMEAKNEIPTNEVQLFLNAVYGRLLARLHGREIPQEILDATEVFGSVLSYLNFAYFDELKDSASS